MQLPKSNTLRYLTVNIPGYMFATMKTDSLAKRLQHAMDLRGLSQAALAEAAGMSQPSVWKITSGKSQSTRKILDIARVLGVRPDWLANGDGHMTDDEDDVYSSESENVELVQGAALYDDLKIVSIWDEEGKTSSVTAVPDIIDTTHARAYKLKYDTGYSDIPAGSIVVVDTKEQPGSRDFVLASIKGTISVYRYSIGGNGALLDADHRVDPIPLDDDAKIIGVIVFMSRSFRR